jgi:CXXX repeat modification system protein
MIQEEMTAFNFNFPKEEQIISQEIPLEEKKEIQTLFERKNGLAELAKILTADNTALYEKLVHDMGETNIRFQKWWDDMGAKYNWESHPDGNWEINFQTNEILLVL